MDVVKLTKSDFLTFLDSPLHLWAKKNNQLDVRAPDLYAQHLSRQGYEVEKLAKQFLKQKVATEYEDADLSFQSVLTDGSYEARIDALVHDKKHGTYDLYEIKSSTSIHKEHKYDVTFQYLVGKAQLNIHKIYLVRANNKFVKNGEINLREFFVVEDMMETVGKLEDEVYQLRLDAINTLKLPATPLDDHCHKPNDCPCKSLCHSDLGEYPIYDLTRGSKKQYQALLDMGVRDLKDIPNDFKLNPKQLLQLHSIQQDEPIIDVKAIKKELDSLVYPLYFLDYETFGTAVPIHDGYSPYQHFVFQYSIHIIDSPEAKSKHEECLITTPNEPSGEVTERLLSVIGDTGSVIVWNKGFECGRNSELAKLQPQHASRLEDINKRTYDLMDVFKKGYYVDYRFHGSASIKKVLPVLVPELSYKELSIGEGTAAMMAWWDLVHGKLSKGKNLSVKKQAVMGALLKYCELDTWAMVEIWNFLKELDNG